MEELYSLSNKLLCNQNKIGFGREMQIESFSMCLMSSKRRSNAIIKINVNGLQVEGVNNVRSAVFNHFETHFQLSVCASLVMDNLNFKSISMGRGDLVKHFSLEEVGKTICDCDNFKSLGSDGINIGFIKRIGWS